MNRFWKIVLTGTAAGAIIGAYHLYTRSKTNRSRLMMGDSHAEEMASKMTSRIMRTTNRFAKDIGEEVARAGRTVQALGKRLSMGGVD